MENILEQADKAALHLLSTSRLNNLLEDFSLRPVGALPHQKDARQKTLQHNTHTMQGGAELGNTKVKVIDYPHSSSLNLGDAHERGRNSMMT